MPLFGSFSVHGEPLVVPPWKNGGYAGSDVPTVSVPEERNVAVLAQSAAVAAAAGGLEVVDDVPVPELVLFEQAASTSANATSVRAIFRITCPLVPTCAYVPWARSARTRPPGQARERSRNAYFRGSQLKKRDATISPPAPHRAITRMSFHRNGNGAP